MEKKCLKTLFMDPPTVEQFIEGRLYKVHSFSKEGRFHLIDEEGDVHGISGEWLKYFKDVP